MASEKMRCRSQAQNPRPYPAGRRGLDLPDEIHGRLEFTEDGRSANEQRDQPNDGRERTPLWARRGENGGDEVAASRAHEPFKLRCKLMGHLLPIEHEPDHAHDEEHQWRQGQGGVVGQRGGQPEAVVLPPVLDRTEDHVPERRDRHSFPLLPKVTRIERASGIIAAIGPAGKDAAGAAAAIVQVARGATWHVCQTGKP